MSRRWLLALVLVSCARETRARGGVEAYNKVPLYRAPEDRCLLSSNQPRRHAACAEARTLAEIYVRRLSVGDPLCLDGAFGESTKAASCRARAAVVDVAHDRVLVEVREAQPDSQWFDKELREFWYEEGALVDLYLKDHGY